MPSATTDYAITSESVFKSTNGGVTCRALSINPNGAIRTVYFLNDTEGYIGGGDFASTIPHVNATSYIMRTTNGGTSWATTFFSSNTTPVMNINMVGSSSGYAVTARKFSFPALNGVVLHTTNSTTWATVTSPAGSFDGLALDAVGSLEVFAGSGPVLYRTADGGVTWIPVLTNGTSNIRCVQFSISQWGRAVGDDGTVWRTTSGGDGPAEWSQLASFTTNDLNSIHFVSLEGTGWATPNVSAAQAGIYRSDDAGATFRDELPDSPFAGPGNLKSVAIYNRSETNALAVGTDGSVRRFENFTNQPIGIAIAPPVLDLGAALVDSNVFRTFTLQNKGDAPLTVSDFLVDGVSRTNSGYRITNAIPFTLAVNASRPIGIIALNPESGPTNATLSIISDGAAQSVNVQLRSSAALPPQVVTFQTDPPGLTLRVDGVTLTSPVSYTIAEDASGPNEWFPDSTHTIEAFDFQTVNGQTFAFESWENGQDQIFTDSFALDSSTHIASYVQDDPPPGSGGTQGEVIGSVFRGPGGNDNPNPLVAPPAGITNGPWMRLSQASIKAPILGNFSVNGAALLSANLIQLSLASTSVRIPTNTSQPAALEMTSGSWQFLRSNSLTRLSVASPGLKLLTRSVAPPGNLNLDFAGTVANPTFSGSFSLTNGWKPAPGLLEFGPSSISVGFTNFLSFSSSGQVRALKKPNGNWGYVQSLNLKFQDGPWTNSIPLPSSIMQILVPGTASEFVEVHGGGSSFLKFFRNSVGDFGLELDNLSLDLLGQANVTTVSGLATSGGVLNLTVAPPANPFVLGPFTWDPNGSSSLSWNVKSGFLKFHLAGGTVSSSISGWTDPLTFPDVDFDSQGDFNYTLTMPSLQFDGISLGLASDANDRYIKFKRHNGTVSLKMRDKQSFFDGGMSLGFDFDSGGNVSGFFNASFGVDFGWPMGYVNFGDVNTSYDSSRTPYQFMGDLRVAGNDFRVKFGSGGGSVCHLICGDDGCFTTICLP